MRTRRLGWAGLFSLVAAAGLSACSSAPSAGEVGEKTAAYTSSLVKKTNVAVAALQGMEAFSALENGLGPLGGTAGTAAGLGLQKSALYAKVDAFARAQATRVQQLRPARVQAASLAEDGADADAMDAQALERYLQERVFTQANLEDTSGRSAIFRLEGADVCPYVVDPVAGTSVLVLGPGESYPLDAACVAEVDALVLRMRATEVGADGLDLTPLVGGARAGPFTLELRPTSLALVLDFAGLRGMLEHLQVEVPGTMQGVVDLKLTVHGEDAATGEVDVELSSSIRSAIDVRDGSYGFQSAQRTPWVSLRVDDIDEALTARLDLGETTVVEPVLDSAGVSRQQTSVLGGASFTLAAEVGQTEFVLSDVSLGTATTRVSVEGRGDALRLDVNPGYADRSFDLRFRCADAACERTEFTFDPDFEARAYFQDSILSATPEPAFAGVEYRWSLTSQAGPPPSVLVWDVEETDGLGNVVATREYLQVLPGATLALSETLDASGPGEGLTVPEGLCLLPVELPPTSSPLDQWTAGDCPL